MKVFVSTLCAAVLALSPVAVGSAAAGSIAQPAVFTGSAASVMNEVVEVRGHRYNQYRRGSNPRAAHRRGWDNRAHRGNPHRHYHQRHARPQSRGPDLGSAVVGAIVGGLIVNQLHQQQPRSQPNVHHHGSYLSHNHISWCHNRWRSYRVVDNSYQPYNGPRRICVSPYGPT